MILIDSLKEISVLRKEIKEKNPKSISNLLVLPDELDTVISSGNLFYEKEGSSIFIFYKTPRCYRLFYFSPSYNVLEKDLGSLSLPQNVPVILEEINRGAVNNLSLKPDMILKNLQAAIPSNFEPRINLPLEFASTAEITEIEKILCNNFDSVCERVPDSKELKELIENKDIIIFKNQDKIKGLLISNLDRRNLHLRYWWVDKSERGKGVGSNLMNYYFLKAIEKKASGLVLWVGIENFTAQKCYSHYGFVENNRFDYIYRLQ